MLACFFVVCEGIFVCVVGSSVQTFERVKDKEIGKSKTAPKKRKASKGNAMKRSNGFETLGNHLSRALAVEKKINEQLEKEGQKRQEPHPHERTNVVEKKQQSQEQNKEQSLYRKFSSRLPLTFRKQIADYYADEHRVIVLRKFSGVGRFGLQKEGKGAVYVYERYGEKMDKFSLLSFEFDEEYFVSRNKFTAWTTVEYIQRKHTTETTDRLAVKG